MQILPYLQVVTQNAASDLHLKSKAKPMIRINGELWPLDTPELSQDAVKDMIYETMSEEISEMFESKKEVDYAVDIPDLGRFRANAFHAADGPSIVLRRIQGSPFTLEELGFPMIFKEMLDVKLGLILVTGPTGSGKTTTLAAMIDYINKNKHSHILTIEDPIEYIHENMSCMVSQREIRTDTHDFPTALRSALRQDPDVIMLGEIRDTETVEGAIRAAETGHLVMATLHTPTAADTVNRIIDMFPVYARTQARLSLAGVIQGIICQRLLKRADGQGRVAAMEIAVRSNRIVEAIADPDKTSDIEMIISEGSHYGMTTFQQDLVRLTLNETVGMETALAASTNPNDFRFALKRTGG